MKAKGNKKVEKMLDTLAAFATPKPRRINWEKVNEAQEKELLKHAYDLLESACCPEVKWVAEEFLILRQRNRQLEKQHEALVRAARDIRSPTCEMNMHPHRDCEFCVLMAVLKRIDSDSSNG